MDNQNKQLGVDQQNTNIQTVPPQTSNQIYSKPQPESISNINPQMVSTTKTGSRSPVVKLVGVFAIVIIIVLAFVGYNMMKKSTSENDSDTANSELTSFSYNGFKFNYFEGSAEGDTPGTVDDKSLLSPAMAGGNIISFDFSQRAATTSGTFVDCPKSSGKETLAFTVTVNAMNAEAKVCNISSTRYFVFIPSSDYNYSFNFTSSKGDLADYTSDIKSIVGSITPL